MGLKKSNKGTAEVEGFQAALQINISATGQPRPENKQPLSPELAELWEMVEPALTCLCYVATQGLSNLEEQGLLKISDEKKEQLYALTLALNVEWESVLYPDRPFMVPVSKPV
jgi:hypothetical protein